MFSPLTEWSWRAEERRNLNAPRHLSPLYEEKRCVDKTVTVCRHCGRGLHWDWVPPGKGLAGAGGVNFAAGG